MQPALEDDVHRHIYKTDLIQFIYQILYTYMYIYMCIYLFMKACITKEYNLNERI